MAAKALGGMARWAGQQQDAFGLLSADSLASSTDGDKLHGSGNLHYRRLWLAYYAYANTSVWDVRADLSAGGITTRPFYDLVESWLSAGMAKSPLPGQGWRSWSSLLCVRRWGKRKRTRVGLGKRKRK
jgi:hypothetical protein